MTDATDPSEAAAAAPTETESTTGTAAHALSVVLVGPPGAGKSTIGRKLARELGLELYDTDAGIEERTGRTIPEIFAADGEPEFRRIEEEVVREAVLAGHGVISLGGGSVLSAATRAVLRGRTVIYLEISVGEGLRRTGASTNRPLLTGDDPAGKYRELMKIRRPLYREVATIRVRTDGRSPGRVVRMILAKLGIEPTEKPDPTEPTDPTPTPSGRSRARRRRRRGRGRSEAQTTAPTTDAASAHSTADPVTAAPGGSDPATSGATHATPARTDSAAAASPGTTPPAAVTDSGSSPATPGTAQHRDQPSGQSTDAAAPKRKRRNRRSRRRRNPEVTPGTGAATTSEAPTATTPTSTTGTPASSTNAPTVGTSDTANQPGDSTAMSSRRTGHRRRSRRATRPTGPAATTTPAENLAAETVISTPTTTPDPAPGAQAAQSDHASDSPNAPARSTADTPGRATVNAPGGDQDSAHSRHRLRSPGESSGTDSVGGDPITAHEGSTPGPAVAETRIRLRSDSAGGPTAGRTSAGVPEHDDGGAADAGAADSTPPGRSRRARARRARARRAREARAEQRETGESPAQFAREESEH
ncbi:Shikimate kinase [Nocardia otitidiscaviarum]|uniref:Shikimate kinase n=1 Tax=Nocardia otitidiscaviarum TaxID=1823 RepID=A0A378YWD7_9NOCA|nr:Shikimate kinase [Nocardia otitidiscaviarum]